MRLLIIIIIVLVVSCFTIEEMDHIPKAGEYISIDSSYAYVNRLTIVASDKGYEILFEEEVRNAGKSICSIEATGKKSSYGIWVELPQFGPRLPVIIRKREENIEISLKGPDDPKEVFRFCNSNRSPAGIYELIQ